MLRGGVVCIEAPGVFRVQLEQRETLGYVTDGAGTRRPSARWLSKAAVKRKCPGNKTGQVVSGHSVVPFLNTHC